MDLVFLACENDTSDTAPKQAGEWPNLSLRHNIKTKSPEKSNWEHNVEST